MTPMETLWIRRAAFQWQVASWRKPRISAPNEVSVTNERTARLTWQSAQWAKSSQNSFSSYTHSR
ncbi:hypothetical protein CTA1_961 [Colletotrichum tanaceti]|uniref:Uncharacterized protein n=1 Tax=Colletotrichum tanaceti TaxID=1306861 RepID=A0A4U6XH99_9PEZI|nr:hypothetical protein CTA1_961 [Colletotrichum tanaceti]